MLAFLQKLYRHYQGMTPFTDSEAWAIFRLAAISEAVGWTVLVVGIVLRDIVWIDNPYTVALAGTVHGGLFILYIVAVLLVAPSLRWPLPVTIIAGLCSIPPFGSLLFEHVAGNYRRHHDFRTLFRATYLRTF